MQKLRKFLVNISGYWIYKKKHLPIGADFKEDLTYKFNIHPQVIFDVGAHYGETALYYREEFPKAKIYSFEPVKKSYEILVKNTQHDKNIHCLNFALGEKPGAVEIFLYDDYYSPMNSIKHGNQSGAKEAISVYTLNDFIKEKRIAKIDLLKIDTEGFELEVLKGGENILSSGSVSAIIAECGLSNTNDRNTKLADLINYLDKFGYYFTGLYDIDARTYHKGITYANALFISRAHNTGANYTFRD